MATSMSSAIDQSIRNATCNRKISILQGLDSSEKIIWDDTLPTLRSVSLRSATTRGLLLLSSKRNDVEIEGSTSEQPSNEMPRTINLKWQKVHFQDIIFARCYITYVSLMTLHFSLFYGKKLNIPHNLLPKRFGSKIWWDQKLVN